jgi:DNA processing protein
MTTRLTDDQRLAWLRLIRSENIGPRTFKALLNRFGGAAAALEALPDVYRRSGRSGQKIMSREEAEREVEATARLGGRFVATGEPDYPKTLQAIDSAPPLLAMRGDAKALARPMVAVVGSRNASAAGLTFTERLARAVGEAGFTVRSAILGTRGLPHFLRLSGSAGRALVRSGLSHRFRPTRPAVSRAPTLAPAGAAPP